MPKTSEVQKEVKKSNVGMILFFTFLIIAVGFGILVLANNNNNDGPPGIGKVIDEVKTIAKTCFDVQVPYQENEYYTEREPYTDRQCESKTLVYSRGEFNLISSTCNQKVEDCNKYFLGICTDKTVYCTDRTITCSLGINNLDNERGVWKVNFNFFKSGSNNNVETTSFQSRLVDPQSSGEAIGQGKITTKELYDSQYSCSYVISEEPTKQVCRDVINYRDVERTRVVTKYRTERQCN